MSRRTRNTLALAVLGLLIEQPMHPYEMAATLRERNKGTSFKITTGSLYDVVQALHRDGWIRAVETVRAGARPERTVYEHTELGREEFLTWIDQLIREPVDEHTKFIAAVGYLGALGPEGSVSALTERVQRLTERIAQTEELMHSFEVPRLFVIEVEYALSMWRAEVRWLESTAKEIVDGTLTWPKPGEY